MNTLSSKYKINIIEKNNSLSKKELVVSDFNNQLQDFISYIKSTSLSEERNVGINLNKPNKNKTKLNDIPNESKIRPKIDIINPILNINFDIKINDLTQNQFKKLFPRLNIENLICTDHFANSFILIPSNNYNNGNNYNFPYMKPFNDNIFKTESIFAIFDKSQKNKFLTKKDIKNITNGDQKLNFGKDPYDIYNKINNRNIFTF